MSDDVSLKLKSLLNQAYEQRVKIQGHLETLNKFISEMEAAAKTLAELDEGVPILTVDKFESKAASKNAKHARMVGKNPDKRDVAAQVAAMLFETDKPMSRREIYNKLKEQGIDIQGKDPEMVLSTMLWRAGEEFSIENKKGIGYILKGKDYHTLG
ncbi:hypothetical protein AB9E28_29790 [Rhizobium leguminosarum]|uniref:hypothetical protein n=1 Tax=Rhizobium leguminosarum TaxID=384 RepID=UPI003F970EBA